jgi:hypothetical protein
MAAGGGRRRTGPHKRRGWQSAQPRLGGRPQTRVRAARALHIRRLSQPRRQSSGQRGREGEAGRRGRRGRPAGETASEETQTVRDGSCRAGAWMTGEEMRAAGETRRAGARRTG